MVGVVGGATAVVSRPDTQTSYRDNFILWVGIAATVAVDLSNIRVCRLDPKCTQDHDNESVSGIGERHFCFMKAAVCTMIARNT
jgi:hypothetical protein